jgi:hypothetical protein
LFFHDVRDGSKFIMQFSHVVIEMGFNAPYVFQALVAEGFQGGAMLLRMDEKKKAAGAVVKRELSAGRKPCIRRPLPVDNIRLRGSVFVARLGTLPRQLEPR